MQTGNCARFTEWLRLEPAPLTLANNHESRKWQAHSVKAWEIMQPRSSQKHTCGVRMLVWKHSWHISTTLRAGLWVCWTGQWGTDGRKTAWCELQIHISSISDCLQNSRGSRGFCLQTWTLWVWNYLFKGSEGLQNLWKIWKKICHAKCLMVLAE